VRRTDLLPEFSVTVATVEGRTVVTTCGEVDVASAPMLRAALHQVQAAPDGAVRDGTLVVDLSAVTFLDASALGVLAAAAMHARRSGGRVVLRDPTPIAVKLLEITGLLRVFLVERRDGGGAAPGRSNRAPLAQPPMRADGCVEHLERKADEPDPAQGRAPRAAAAPLGDGVEAEHGPCREAIPEYRL
jgi:anti-anti-sigma factor